MLVRPKHARLAQRRFLRSFSEDLTPSRKGHNWARKRQTQRAARVYLTGLLQPVRVKSMERLAVSGGIPSHRLQQFITDSPWDPGQLLHSLRTRMGSLTSSRGLVVLDDTGQAKQGTHSVGVGRQYSGTLARVGNCQVAVTAIYLLPNDQRNADQISWPLGMELYLPKDWTEDPVRRAETAIPPGVGFRTKPQIALGIVQKVREERIPHRAVVADAGYGDSDELRAQLRSWNEPYVLGVNPSSHKVQTEGSEEIHSIREILRGLPEGAWQEVSWGEGTKGRLHGRFVRMRVRGSHQHPNHHHGQEPSGEDGWLLLERRENEDKAYWVWGLDDASLEDHVALAHGRWAIEQFHREIKQTLGMDKFQGRTWTGWHHHMAMVALAYGFLALLRADTKEGGPPPPFNVVHWHVVYALVRFDILKGQGLTKAQEREIALRFMERALGLPQPPE